MSNTLQKLEAMRNMPDQPRPVDLSAVKAENVKGRVIVIIGANVGLGFEAAKHFASMNPLRLVLGCRSEEKGKKAVKDIQESTGFQNVELRLIDLSNFASIPPFVDGIAGDIGRVDLLILNAGINNGQYEQTKDGWELVLQTNNLGLELAALLMLPTLLKTEKESEVKPRIVVVSSGAYAWASLDDELVNHPTPLQRLSDKDYCTPEVIDMRYAHTKLINILFARHLQGQLINAKSSIIVNALSPGYSLTNLGSNMPKEQFEILESVKHKAYTTEQGSRFLVQAALLHAGDVNVEQGLKAAYINRGTVEEPNQLVTSTTGQQFEKTIWNNTIDVLSNIDQRVRSIADQLQGLA